MNGLGDGEECGDGGGVSDGVGGACEGGEEDFVDFGLSFTAEKVQERQEVAL